MTKYLTRASRSNTGTSSRNLTSTQVSRVDVVRGIQAFVFEFSSPSSVLLYLGYAIDRHDTHLYHKKIARTARLECALEHSRISTLEHHARTQVHGS